MEHRLSSLFLAALRNSLRCEVEGLAIGWKAYAPYSVLGAWEVAGRVGGGLAARSQGFRWDLPLSSSSRALKFPG